MSQQQPGYGAPRSPKQSRRAAEGKYGGQPSIRSTNLSPSRSKRGVTYGISRSSNSSPINVEPHVPHSYSSGAFLGQGGGYYSDEQLDAMDPRTTAQGTSGPGGHRSRSATRGAMRSYHERDSDFREPRERSLDRTAVETRHSRSRERSLDRYQGGHRPAQEDAYRETAIDDPYRDPYGQRGHGGGSGGGGYTRDSFIMELQSRLNDLQNQYGTVKRELDATTQKLGSSMHSIKTFWSPELKKERALRKEEAAKYSLINDQLKILRSENQKQGTLVRQLEEELRLSHMRNPDAELQQHLEALYQEKDHMTKEIFLLRETVKELEMRIETQKQTLAARDESIKKLMEMLQNKGIGGHLREEERLEMDRLRSRFIEVETRARHLESLVDVKEKDIAKMEELRIEVNKRDQEILAMGAKMRTLEEQHQDYQRHIAVLKESLCAKEEHYNMLQADVEELRQRLEEKNKLIEKRTHQSMTSSQDRNRLNQELQELRDHMDIKDRKINVLQRKIENLEDLLKEKDNQVDMARARLTAIQAHHSSSEGALSSLEEAISDKEKQITQLREQRDRAEQERNEERELHERELTEYKMKMHGMESEMEKLQTELQKMRKEGSNPQQTSQQMQQLQEKQKSLEDLDKKLKKRKEKLDQLETQLHQAAAGNNDALIQQLSSLKEMVAKGEHTTLEKEKQVLEAREAAKHSQAELERLLQIMSDMEGEKFTLNKQIKELQDALKDKEGKLGAAKRGATTEKTRGAQMMDEARRREAEIQREAAKVQAGARALEARVAELEEALRESVRITAESEVGAASMELQACEAKQKVEELERRLNGRRKNLGELFDMRHEALSTAISETDAQVALLEVSGVKNEKTAAEVDRLRAQKKTLVERLKSEGESLIRMLAELSGDTNAEPLPFQLSRNTAPTTPLSILESQPSTKPNSLRSSVSAPQSPSPSADVKLQDHTTPLDLLLVPPPDHSDGDDSSSEQEVTSAVDVDSHASSQSPSQLVETSGDPPNGRSSGQPEGVVPVQD